MERDRIIEAYIQRLLTWDKPLSQGTLAAIAKEVGITKAKLDVIRLQGQTHLTRGRDYVNGGQLDEAIHEFSHAASIQPVDLEVLHTLANAYNQRYTQQQNPADRQRALMVARRCIELKPSDKEAQVLVSFLEHAAGKKKKPARRPRPVILVTGLVAVGVSLMGLRRLPVFSNTEPLGPTPDAVVTSSDTSGAVANGSETDNPDQKAEFLPGPNVPMLFDYAGLLIEPRLSRLGNYKGDSYYKFNGLLINDSGQEIRKLDLKIDLLDGDGATLTTIDKPTVARRDPVIRPGDTYAFELFTKTPPELINVRISVTDIEQSVGVNTYVPPTPIKYLWETSTANPVRFELASRSERFGLDSWTDLSDQSASAAGKSAFNAEWVVMNTSAVPIGNLRLKADFYDQNNNLLQSEEITAVSADDTPIMPDESRPFRVVKPVADSYERFQVTILEAS